MAADSGKAVPGATDAVLAAPGTGTDDTETKQADPGRTVPGDERPSREPAPKNRGVASTARAAIDAMRRGVVEYTALTD